MSLQNVNSYTYSPGFTQGQYHNAILCISGNVQSLYLNGVLVGSTTTASNILSYYPTINQILVGCAGDKSNGFTGYLDDFRMYKYAFNQSQVSSLYSNRNLIAYYPFDVCFNNVANGIITTANNATLSYDATMIGNASITSTTNNYLVGTGALNLTNTAGATSTAYVKSTCGFSTTATNQLSISLWFKTTGIAGRTMRLIDLSPATGTNGIYIDISGMNGINTLYNNVALVVPSNLVLHWPFDTTMNESVNNYTATLYGTTPAISNSIYKVGTGSLNCTGSLAYVSYTNPNGILPISNTYTFSFWYYPTSNAIYYSRLFSFADGDSNSFYNNDIGLYFNTNTLNVYAYVNTGSTFNVTGNMRTLTANAWNHIVLSMTSISSTIYMNLWINNSKTTHTLTGSIPQVTRRYAYINGGSQNKDPLGNPTTAYVDDFRVYNNLLTDADVTSLYNRLPGVPLSYLQLITNTTDTGNTPQTVNTIGGVRFDVVPYSKQAIFFDSYYIKGSNAITLNFIKNTQFTFCYWIACAPTPNYSTYTLCSITNVTTSSLVLYDSFTSTSMNLFVALPNQWTQTNNTNNFSFQTWTHIAYTIDQTNNTVQLFINGSLTNTLNGSGSIPGTNFLLTLGGSYGAMKEFQYYNTILSSEQIQIIYTTTA